MMLFQALTVIAAEVHLASAAAIAGHLRSSVNEAESSIEAFSYDYSQHGANWKQGVCTSRMRQSPVNFADMTTPATGKLAYNYARMSSSFEVANNGHTLSIDFAGLGMGGITYEGAWYNLMNINIHAKSEHTFMGIHMPVELHVVHKKFDSGDLLIVAVPLNAATPPALLQRSNSSVHQMPPAPSPAPGPGPAPAASLGPPPYVPPDPSLPNHNPLIQFFLKERLPMVNQKALAPVSIFDPFDLNLLLQQGTYFEYAGSLTAPPCAEVATWMVRREPVMVSDQQVAYLHNKIMEMTALFGNNRATMPLNGRPTAVRMAVRDAPPPTAPLPPMPSGPNPATDRSFRAMKWAKDALKIAKASTDYIRDLDVRLRNAAEAHANALAPDLMHARLMAGTTPPPPMHPVGPIDMAKTAESMANALAKQAAFAINTAAQQLTIEAKQAAAVQAAAAANAMPMATIAPPMR
jgi:carbonic anhydrase